MAAASQPHSIYVEFECSSRVCGFSLRTQTWVRLGLGSKFTVGLNMSVNGCLSLYVAPVICWQPVQSGPPHLSPSVSGGLAPAPSMTHEGEVVWMMDGLLWLLLLLNVGASVSYFVNEIK